MTMRCGKTALCWLAAALSLPAQTVIIRAGSLLDGKGGIARNREIVVEGNRIASVSGAKTAATYDLSRYTVMPGWIDVHVHLSGHFNGGRGGRGGESPQQAALYTAGNAYATLLAGFTTVQSLGSPVDVTVRDLINTGVIPGPRILTAIRMIRDTSWSMEQIREEVRRLKAEGADVIKVYGSQSIRDGGGPSLSA